MEVLLKPGGRNLVTPCVTTREILQTHDLALPQMLPKLIVNSVVSCPDPDLANLEFV